MAKTAEYRFENNANDTSGNGRNASIVGNISYIQRDPVAIVGNYCATGLNEFNYISIPQTVLDSQPTTGTIKISFFFREGDYPPEGDSVPDTIWAITPAFDTSRFGFLQFDSNDGVRLVVPTLSSYIDEGWNSYNWRPGRWYTAFIQYSPTSLVLKIKDVAQNITTTVINDTSLSAQPNFSNLAWNYIGHVWWATTYNYKGVLDNLIFYDTIINDETETENDHRIVLQIGHSIARNEPGAFNSCQSDGVSRDAMLDVWQSNSKPWYFYGDYTVGSGNITPYTSAIGGYTSVDIEPLVQGFLTNVWDSDVQNQIMLIGPIFANDELTGIPVSTSKTAVSNIIDTIHAYSSGISMFLVNDPGGSAVPNIPSYNTAMSELYTEKLSEGKNVNLIDIYGIGNCYDNLHLTESQYINMGYIIGSGVYNVLSPPTPPTPTLPSLNIGNIVFIKILSPTPTPFSPANLSPAVWYDPSDTNTITLNGSTVSQINDKSGNLQHLTQENITLQPIYTVASPNWNNLNVLTFSSDRIQKSSISTVLQNLSKYETFVLHRITSLADRISFSLEGPAGEFNNYTRVFNFGGYRHLNGIVSNQFAYVSTITISEGSSYINNTRFDNTGSTNTDKVKMAIDGNDYSLTYSVNPMPSTAQNITNITLGDISTGGIPWIGDVAEIVVFNKILSTDERVSMITYLKEKWGIA